LRFYLGTHRPHWLALTDVDLFVSHRTLTGRKSYPRATCDWALDSGGFTELSMYGEWRTTPAQYVQAVNDYIGQIGRLQWAAPQDWMCEPSVRAMTGKTVQEHQERTVQNYLDLATHGPFIPVLQGWYPEEYEKHVEMYEEAGVVLVGNRVGVGSVCRRNNTRETEYVLKRLSDYGLRLHGFGFKRNGLEQAGHLLDSSDSLAWSYAARQRPIRLPGCEHKKCANCLKWALQWRGEVVEAIERRCELMTRYQVAHYQPALTPVRH
jgi:hypothetical protein